eukprot:108160-Pleurochrysis_carterae.AAC.4
MSLHTLKELVETSALTLTERGNVRRKAKPMKTRAVAIASLKSVSSSSSRRGLKLARMDEPTSPLPLSNLPSYAPICAWCGRKKCVSRARISPGDPSEHRVGCEPDALTRVCRGGTRRVRAALLPLTLARLPPTTSEGEGVGAARMSVCVRGARVCMCVSASTCGCVCVCVRACVRACARARRERARMGNGATARVAMRANVHQQISEIALPEIALLFPFY